MTPKIFLKLTRLPFSPIWRIIIVCVLCVGLLPVEQVTAKAQAQSTIAISSILPSPAYIGQTVVVQVQAAAVNPMDGIPTGAVEIRSGQNMVCGFPLDGTGAGSCALIFNTPATVPLKAVYLGSDAFIPSVSTEINLVVKNKHTPTLQITDQTPNPSYLNSAVNVLAGIVSDGPTPIGDVTIWSSDSTCTAPPASSAVDKCFLTLAGGVGTCSITSTTAGKNYLCASYPGDVYNFPVDAIPVAHYTSATNTFTEITKIEPEPSLLNEETWVYFNVIAFMGQTLGTEIITVSNGINTCSAPLSEGKCKLVFTKAHLNDVTASYPGALLPLKSPKKGFNQFLKSDGLDPSVSEVFVHRVNVPPSSIKFTGGDLDAFAAAGTVVGTFTATDLNTDESHVFTLVPGDGGQDNGYFSISEDKLLLRGSVPSDRDSLSIRVRATDPAGLTYDQIFAIGVNAEVELPETGFAPLRVTLLPPQPLEKQYQSSGVVTLEIPSLGVSADVTGIPFVDGGWDATWLWNQVGWLNGSAFPGWPGNSVIAGHNYLSNGLPGPFANVQSLKWGDQIRVTAYGETMIYEVRSVKVVDPQQDILKHEKSSWLTLVTCKSYNETTGTYRWRVVVRAVLVDVQ